jgi:PIN domain nuclease of toxin-antitoxin system
VIVLDTHVWFWLVTEPRRLTPAAIAAIDTADAIGVPAISCWEIAMLSEKGRVGLDRPAVEWLRAALAAPGAVLLSLEPEVAALAASLALHGDPADRLIVATALHHGSALVTKDEAIRRASLVQTVW